jgi:hypothetical protein
MLMQVSQVVSVEVVAGIQAQAQLAGYGGCMLVGGYGLGSFSFGKQTSVPFGVQFYAVGAGKGSAANHFFRRIYKNRYPDACIFEDGNRVAQVLLMFQGIPAVVAGKLTFSIGHQGYLVGFHFQYQVNKFLLSAVAFYIKLGTNDGFNGSYIGITNMSLIGAGMYRYAIGAKGLHVYGGLHHIRVAASTAVAQGGYFVDVHRKFGHFAAN